MELRHFRYFSAVAVFGSFSKAARHLNISQPALSRQVKDLEEELGIMLISRDKKKISLTSAGESFYGDVAAILKNTEDCVRRLRNQKGSELLRVGYCHSLSGEMMPKVISRFQAIATGVRVELRDLPTYEIARQAASGLLDVVVFPKNLEPDFRGFQWAEVQRLSPVLVLSKFHPLTKKMIVTPADLTNVTLFGFRPTAFPEYVPRLRAILKPFRVVPELSDQLSDDIPALLVAVESNRGAAVLTEGITKMVPASLRVRRFSPDLSPLVVAAGVPALNSNHHAEIFVDILLDEADKRRGRKRSRMQQ